MPLSWNEIKSRATAFSKEWENEISEDAEAKSFWDDFFNVFGISRRRVAAFELQVKKANARTGYIDLLWKGVILVEHKSRGRDLDKAYSQAKDYFPGLTEKELPRYILVSDFERFRLYDLEEGSHHDFTLTKLIDHVHLFGFIAGYQKRVYKEQDPVNIEAAELMGRLHDKLKAIGYTGHNLELYLVRLLFCLFADDTSIFEKGIFYDYIDLKTNPDGSDLAMHIEALFAILNTPETNRLRNLDESIAAFPYVNGKLFEERLPLAGFDASMRKTLLDCCLLDWGKISPAIFGSLFQSVMDDKARRNLGAHYTSEKNILKVIRPLFLDELYEEFEGAKNDKRRLNKLHDKLSKLKFLDPACGCGNFLIIAYRELRLLELEIVKVLLKGQQVISVNDYFLINVDQFYGIEYEEFPSQIAQVAMWLMDHQMNEQASIQFGEYFKRIPLKKSATIVYGNALSIDWQTLTPSQTEVPDLNIYNYILGNPPFIGKHLQNDTQRRELRNIFIELSTSGDLDYVSAWYKLACDYMEKNPLVQAAFVSTNSITQGEQVLILWEYLIRKYSIEINFAHRTFKWNNEAKGNANVHVVIVGFGKVVRDRKYIFDYDSPTSEPHIIESKFINPYLLPTFNTFIRKQQKPICSVPEMRCGNKPADGGHLILSDEERDEITALEPSSKKFIKEFVGSVEFLNDKRRWCLWLKGAEPSEFRKNRLIVERVNQVKEFRNESTAAPTKKAANYPSLFFYISQPSNKYIVIPEVSSERRKYIPLGILEPDIISSNKIFLIESSDLYYLGVLSSLMHMSWIRVVAGRMKSDYSYSGTIVYNTFPWPEHPTEKQKQTVEKAAQAVLDIRASFSGSSLADLYDPNTMPPGLVKAHMALDKAVDLCYRSQPFINETKRIEYLFELYDKYTAGLFVKQKKKVN